MTYSSLPTNIRDINSRTGRNPLPPTQPQTAYYQPELYFTPPRTPELGNDFSSSQDPRIGTYLGDNQSLQLQEVLGSGAYGVVYRAVDTYNGTPYAVKALNKYTAEGLPLDARQVEFQRREIWLHHRASGHPNVVRILKILDHTDCTFVILEYCPEGDLFSNITERGQYVGKDAEARAIFLQILEAVSHCHGLGIYHRDLKPENILVTARGSQVKLADFGLAVTDVRTGDFGCGSTFYMSPECQNQAPVERDYACAPNDVWSLGVILVNLTCGRNPWKKAAKEDSTFRAFLKDSNFLETILPISHELNQLLKRIFEMDPEKRITIGELKEQMKTLFHLTTTNDLPSPPPTPARRHNRRQEINSVKPDAAFIFQNRVNVPAKVNCEWQDRDTASISSDEDYVSETDSLPSMASGSSCDEAIEFEEDPLPVFTPAQELPAQSYFAPSWQTGHNPQICGFGFQQMQLPPSPPPEDVMQNTYFPAQQCYEPWPQQTLYVQPQPKGGFLQTFHSTFQHIGSNCRSQMPIYVQG